MRDQCPFGEICNLLTLNALNNLLGLCSKIILMFLQLSSRKLAHAVINSLCNNSVSELTRLKKDIKLTDENKGSSKKVLLTWPKIILPT